MLIQGIEYTLEEIAQAAELFPYSWMLKYDIKTSAGLPFEFSDHGFMIEPLNDQSRLQVILKPPQIGATETFIVKSLYIAKKKKKDIIYTLPTQADVQDMAGGKINRIIAQNPILQSWVKEHDTVEQKQVGDNIIYYRGTFSNKQAMMVTSQLNIHDEVDASDASVITQYETRQQASADGSRWYFSHPSLSGFGVDIYWQQSDQKEWHITCPTCKTTQILSFPQNIDEDTASYICSSCRAVLSDSDRRDGYWKPTTTGIYSGYHISQLMCPWITAKVILEAYRDPQKDKQYFYNYVLGLPYVGSDAKIQPHEVLKNCIPDVNSQEGKIIIGVDTGLPIHYTILNKEGVFYYGKCKEPDENYDPYDELEGFLKRWPKAILVSDQGGDLIGIRKLQAKYKGRVFLCYYRKDRKTQETIVWGEGDQYGQVVVDRNKMMQLMIEQLRDVGRIRLNGIPDDWKEFASHFGNIYRELVTVKESKDKDIRTLYGNEFVWKRNGPDHFVHTLLYALVGLDRYGFSAATVVGSNDFDKIPTARLFAEPSASQLVAGYGPAYVRENQIDLS